ncbi:MAG: flagellar motor switch protein FliN [Granulosicoccus sp.]
MAQENTARAIDEAGEEALGAEAASIEADAGASANAGTNVSGISGASSRDDMSMVLDIPVTLSMEIGQTRITINELLKLGKDSVVELQRMADEPMDILVNGTLVAHGEAVVVGDRFGVRLLDVISPQERLKKFT